MDLMYSHNLKLMGIFRFSLAIEYTGAEWWKIMQKKSGQPIYTSKLSDLIYSGHMLYSEKLKHVCK